MGKKEGGTRAQKLVGTPFDSAKQDTQWVFSFQEGGSDRRNLLGGKGAELAEMTSLGLPVPPGFTITTEACLDYYRADKRVPDGLWDQVGKAMKDLEKATGRSLGDPSEPLLVSVRSGAAISMPGMMDTVLNLGINQEVAEGIAQRTGNERFALDLHRRFIQMFGNVVLGVEGRLFDRTMEETRTRAGVGRDADLSPDDLRGVVGRFARIVRDESGSEVPSDPWTQLQRSIEAVFKSWNTRRAIDYRNYHGISHDLGTAVNIVMMVFGNMDERSCSGVLFTRDPANGEKSLYGEYLVNAQGEDVVSGIATPLKIARMAREIPDVYKQLVEVSENLERRYRDAQDLEFTVEGGRLFMLQTRTAKRSAKAAVVMAVEMAQEGVITKQEALLRVDPEQIYQLLLPRLDEEAKEQATKENRLIEAGLGASPGGATGKAVFTADRAAELGAKGVGLILVRPETSAEDVHGMLAANGILTSRGGATSHAAVVARGLGKPCVAGAESIDVNPDDGVLRCGGITVKEGEEISIDGASGQVFVGTVTTIQPHVSDERELIVLLGWADDAKRLGVWANADYPRDARVAAEFGAEGIGLCRTEHMFFEPERLAVVREMILKARASTQDPEDTTSRDRYQETLAELRRLQVGDFEGILQAMDGKPVVIRLLDAPLHEFLPGHDELLTEVVELRVKGDDPAALAEKEALLAAVGDLREANPMLGMRGCRLGLMYPDIYAMQMMAVLEAASNVSAQGLTPRPEIMVPLVGHGNEMRELRELLEDAAGRFHRETDSDVHFKIGTMIEIPRAALTADEIAKNAEFFSFGTNDLTQTTFGISRDDAEGKFLMDYVDKQVLPNDPFQVVDRNGVGQLVQMAFERGRKARPDLEVGICGEHGGDPSSVEFFHGVGLDYVSCSPYRIPIARLAAAQAALRSADK